MQHAVAAAGERHDVRARLLLARRARRDRRVRRGRRPAVAAQRRSVTRRGGRGASLESPAGAHLRRRLPRSRCRARGRRGAQHARGAPVRLGAGRDGAAGPWTCDLAAPRWPRGGPRARTRGSWRRSRSWTRRPGASRRAPRVCGSRPGRGRSTATRWGDCRAPGCRSCSTSTRRRRRLDDVIGQARPRRARSRNSSAVEQPFARGDVVGAARPRADGWTSRWAWTRGCAGSRTSRSAVAARAAGLICVKPARVGGLVEARALMARAARLRPRRLRGRLLRIRVRPRGAPGPRATRCASAPSDLGPVARRDFGGVEADVTPLGLGAGPSAGPAGARERAGEPRVSGLTLRRWRHGPRSGTWRTSSAG